MTSSPAATIRDAVSADLEAIVSLERSAAGAAHWDRSEYARALDVEGGSTAKRILLVAESNAEPMGVCGFAVARVIADEWEVENVVVASDSQQKGIGGLLLRDLIERAQRHRATRILLEVRESNVPAIALYKKHGFLQDGIRQSYYSNPTEDAILFSLSLKNSS